MSKGYINLRTMMAVGAMIALTACGGNTASNVPSTSSVDTGTAVATSEAASGAAGTTGTEVATSEAAGAVATESPTEASTASSSATTGTSTPEAGTTGSTTTGANAATALTGPNISYNGVTFDVDQSSMPSVTVQNGSVNMMGAGSTSSSSTAGSGTLSGTIFTFEGMNMSASGAGATTGGTAGFFQPRIVVIPVSQLVSYESSLLATGAAGTSSGSSTTGTTTPEATTASSNSSTTGTTTPEATTSSSTSSSSSASGTSTPEASTSGSATGQGMNDNTFISELSRTLASQSAFPSTSMANSIVLTRALSLMGIQGYTPAFQSNGEFLTFKNGHGVRFVTAFQAQGSNPAPLNQLYYMFHGLTNDNQYYVMALMPLQSNLINTAAGASATGSGTSSSSSSTTSGTATPAAGTTMSDTTGTGTTGAGNTGAIQFPSSGDASAYQSYLDQVVSGLDQSASGSNDAAFSQSLKQYDTLIQSLNVSASAQ